MPAGPPHRHPQGNGTSNRPGDRIGEGHVPATIHRGSPCRTAPSRPAQPGRGLPAGPRGPPHPFPIGPPHATPDDDHPVQSCDSRDHHTGAGLPDSGRHPHHIKRHRKFRPRCHSRSKQLPASVSNREQRRRQPIVLTVTAGTGHPGSQPGAMARQTGGRPAHRAGSVIEQTPCRTQRHGVRASRTPRARQPDGGSALAVCASEEPGTGTPAPAANRTVNTNWPRRTRTTDALGIPRCLLARRTGTVEVMATS
jgi:hypothetical protein